MNAPATRLNIGPWIPTASGRRIDLLNPNPADVHWPDVADSLARLCRFTGNLRPGLFYSVAQHSDLVRGLTPPPWRLYALLHDAHEFAIGDMSSPLKVALQRLGDGGAWERIETAHAAAVHRAAGLDWPPPREAMLAVHHADRVALATERRDLLTESPGVWIDLPDPAPQPIVPWPHALARERFALALAQCGLMAYARDEAAEREPS